MYVISTITIALLHSQNKFSQTLIGKNLKKDKNASSMPKRTKLLISYAILIESKEAMQIMKR